MYQLIRITSKDYKNFRRTYKRINYSFFKKGEEQPWVSKHVNAVMQSEIKGKGDFLDEVEDPQNELYFFEIDNQIQGIVELKFFDGACDIFQFAVLEHGKGLGTTLFEETIKIIKEHKCKKIVLWCPFEGAQYFWKKQGFRQSPKDDGFFERKI